MKKILFLFLFLSSFAVTAVAADELKDNRLQIDNSRIEKEQELNLEHNRKAPSLFSLLRIKKKFRK